MWFKDTKTKQQIITYILVGMLNTAFSYLCYASFIYLGLSYPLALLYATIIGVCFNFKTTGKIVFKNTNNLLFFKFISVYICIYFFNTTLVGFLKSSFDLYTAGFIALFPSAILGFILNKNLVFKGTSGR
ncbi:MAG: GtrA family protein [Tatlockia sp.]|nr:GtrA family protein [Tatlockia sp.]